MQHNTWQDKTCTYRMTVFNPMQCVRTPVHTDTKNPRPSYEREFEAVCDPGYREQQPGRMVCRCVRYR